MPNFVSVFGEWKPATEKVYLPDEEKIYEGADRAALQMLQDNGGTIGQHFKMSADLVMRVKNLGFSSVDEYLKFMGFDEKKHQERFDQILKKVQKHDLPKRTNAVTPPSGGDDTSGHGNHIKGEFAAPSGVNVPRMKG